MPAARTVGEVAATDTASGLLLPLMERAQAVPQAIAVIDAGGPHSYAELLDAGARVASALLDGSRDLAEARVAFLVPPGFGYPAVQWGIWRSGGIAVPLSPLHPRPELEYAIEDSGASLVVAHPEFAAVRMIAEARGLRFLPTPDALAAPRCVLPAVEAARRAMILYTSGTTSKPKGVVSTHACIQAQIDSLIVAWEWRPDDRILHVLPLHHIHGIVNVLGCALGAGATCEFLPKFDGRQVWQRFLAGGLTLFMAVPTIYERLIAAWESAPPGRRRAMTAACAQFRLMVSGSAALPVRTLEAWRRISGHTLVERYGMTEIGMALSNPIPDRGEQRPGHVGIPLPGVQARLVDEGGRSVPAGSPGEIEVRGPGVFREYWRRPEATRDAFRDGWFRTGDVAVLNDGSYRILGRNSVDIIKTGGYKVSALEVEEVLREHPTVAECAVVGVSDPEWGERVGAALALRPGTALSLEELRVWAKERLAVYKVPSRLVLVAALPRNAMGKVMKPEVVRLFGR